MSRNPNYKAPETHATEIIYIDFDRLRSRGIEVTQSEYGVTFSIPSVESATVKAIQSFIDKIPHEPGISSLAIDGLESVIKDLRRYSLVNALIKANDS